MSTQDEARKFIESSELKEEVMEQIMQNTQQVDGVPFFIFNKRYVGILY